MFMLPKSLTPPVLINNFIHGKASFYSNISKANNVQTSIGDKIEQLSMFNSIPNVSKINPPLKSNKKDKYLSVKLPKVKEIFGTDIKYQNLISHHLPPTHPSPFHDGLIPSSPPQRDNRLSVTSLLTKSWCELRSAYDIYSQMPRFFTVQLLSGTKEHSNLELKSHPIDLKLVEFNHDFNVPKDRILDQWTRTIFRLISMFQNGEVREIPCFAFIDNMQDNFPIIDNLTSQDWQKLLNKATHKDIDNDPTNQYTMISGIIDHLKLNETSKGFPLSQEINLKDPHVDIHDLINNITSSIQHGDWEIQVADIKTRQTFKPPIQTSVVKASKLQVMYYNKLLSILGKDPNITYQTLMLNAYKRGYDVDKPLDPLKVFSLMLENPFLISDMKRLKNGESIGFPLFDEFNGNSINKTQVDLTSYYDQLNEAGMDHLLEFCTKWNLPVTPRYLAVRLSQLYHLVGEILSKKLIIEYYCRGANFHNIHFDYDDQIFNNQHKNSLEFWFGKRDIEPFEPTIYNFTTFCNNCDYRDVCSWKKKGEDLCKELGNTLSGLSSQH
ncbi:exonuclease V, mitochondrial [Monosporozyma servazzii]